MNASSKTHYTAESKYPLYLHGKGLLTSFTLTFASALQKQHSAEVNSHKAAQREVEKQRVFLFRLPVLCHTFSWDTGNGPGLVLLRSSHETS